MNGNSLLIDSNILLYLLNGEETLIPILNNKDLYLSFITQLEVLSFHGITEVELNKIQGFIDQCIVVDISSNIKDYAIKFRREHRLKLPDAIIAATSIFIDAPLVTADNDFKRLEEEVDVIFYEK